MSKIADFLSQAGVFFLATADGDQPKLRPLGAFLEDGGRVIFGVGDFKEVYRQMTVNPKVEIVACKKDGHWLRYTGKAVFETDDTHARQMVRDFNLGAIYNDQTGNRLMTFYLDDAAAADIPVMGEGESLL